MTTRTKPRVSSPFTVENASRCLCPQCAVQAKSKSVAAKKAGMQAALKKKPLVAEDIPGSYCATGKATCDGLNTAKECSCFDCSVYAEYHLKKGSPECYFCVSGKAK